MPELKKWGAIAVLIIAVTSSVQATEENGRDPEAALTSQKGDLSDYLETLFDEQLALDPEWMTQLGVPGANDRWTRRNEEAAAARFDLAQRSLSRLRTFDPETLDASARLNLEVALYQVEQAVEMYQWRNHQYAATHMFSVHSALPAFLMNFHQINSREDAEDYLARLESISLPIDDVMNTLLARADLGFAPPAFVFPHIIETSRAVMTGAPFVDGGKPAPLLADFTSKIDTLDLSPDDRAILLARVEVALLGVLQPALERLIAAAEDLSERFTENAGVGALDPSGAFYQAMLTQRTTTGLTAEEIHELGLRETARVQEEMRAIKDAVEFDGDLQAFFRFVREDEQFLYPDTEEGKAAYLSEAERLLDEMTAVLPTAFRTLPKAPLEVRRVEAFREASAPKAFYSRPSPDGSRPAVFYVNLYDMTRMPKYQMEALAFHEGVPGHHLEIALSQELEGIPRLRKFAFYTAYSEGWALYAEFLAKEMGFYQDPYSDFGRLSLELWRAARLVTDTGLHAKGWTREEAVDWLIENTPNSEADCRSAIDRYLVLPGQATAYMIGSLKMFEMRERAQTALGDAYDIRDFHEVILSGGPLPLPILERQVLAYIAARRDLSVEPSEEPEEAGEDQGNQN